MNCEKSFTIPFPIAASRNGARHVLTFEECGADKPDERPFRMSLSLLAVTPGDVISIGDDFNSDIVPARKLGMHAIWLQREGAPARLDAGTAASSWAEITKLIFDEALKAA